VEDFLEKIQKLEDPELHGPFGYIFLKPMERTAHTRPNLFVPSLSRDDVSQRQQSVPPLLP